MPSATRKEDSSFMHLVDLIALVETSMFELNEIFCICLCKFATIAGFLKTQPFSRVPTGVYWVINNDDPHSFI